MGRVLIGVDVAGGVDVGVWVYVGNFILKPHVEE